MMPYDQLISIYGDNVAARLLSEDWRRYGRSIDDMLRDGIPARTIMDVTRRMKQPFYCLCVEAYLVCKGELERSES